MFRMLMNSKIHRAQVTQADLNYLGSISIAQACAAFVGYLPRAQRERIKDLRADARA